VLETDWTTMEQRIRTAEFKIRERQHVLSEDHGGTPQESYALASAMNSLWILREDLVWWQNRQRQHPAETSNPNTEPPLPRRTYRKPSAPAVVPMYLIAGRAG
jgi:hypothetical protein